MAKKTIKPTLKSLSLIALLAAGAALVTVPAVAGQVGWAHQVAGSVQSNGAVTVKSLSGGSYVGTQNPTGAVAKTNQNAATQPPTVIIQATSAGYAEMIPLSALSGNATPPAVPSCPTGYTSVWSQQGSGTFTPTWNVAGSRWTWSFFYYNASYYASWFSDNAPWSTEIHSAGSPAASGATGAFTLTGNATNPSQQMGIQSGSTKTGWAANLCAK